MLARLALLLALLPASAGAQANPLLARAAKEFQDGDLEGACRDAAEAVRQNPGDEKAGGLAKLSCEKMKNGLKFKGLKIQRHEIGPRSEKSEAPRDIGRVPVAIPATPPGAVMEEATSYGKTVEAQEAINRGRFPQAAAAAARAISLDPKNLRAHVILAAAYHDSGEAQKSLEAAEAGLKLNPENLSLLKNKAAAQIKLGDFKSAAEAAELALKTNATDPMAHALRAFALGRKGDRDGMFNALKTASALDPAYERLLIDAQAAPEGSPAPFILPGEVQARPAASAMRHKPPEDKAQKKFLFFVLLFVFAVIVVLLLYGLLNYRS